MDFDEDEDLGEPDLYWIMDHEDLVWAPSVKIKDLGDISHV